VQQLESLAGDPAFLSVLAVPSFLEACLAEVERAVGIRRDGRVDSQRDESGEEDVVPLSIFEMQLPVACLVLLGSAAASSSGVLVRLNAARFCGFQRQCALMSAALEFPVTYQSLQIARALVRESIK
jgi:hypothetical protein